MKFDVGRSRERIVVESVSANTSIARSDRPVFKNKESCNDVGFEVKCLAIVKGTFVKTRIGDFPEW
ncbi:MAG: hypothetical protein IPJ30_04410 [Acidobacteria bacterium]|nr:hypothetical protein [Acidobacteriota bacterium]